MLRYLLLLGITTACFTSLCAQNHTVKAMSYNIRYNNPNDGLDAWPNRKGEVCKQMRFYQPDVIGMQEVLQEQLDTIIKVMVDYDYVGVGRDDGKKAGEYAPILYRKTKYNILASGTFWLSPTPEVVSKAWDAALPRICTWVRLEDKQTGFRFWHFNTHFDHRGQVARKESARIIHAYITTLNTEKEPVLMSGDFNALPASPPIEFLTRHYHDAWIHSVIPTFGPEGTYNGFRADHPLDDRIDYLFFTRRDWDVLRIGHLSTQRAGRFPSDHLPVFGEFIIRSGE